MGFARRGIFKLAGLAALWRGKAAAQSAPPVNPVVHFEIGCRDSARTQQLYRDLFDWKIEAKAGTIQGAGMPGHITALGHEPLKYTMFYVQVEDVAAHIAKAESLGCKRLVGPIKIPTGTFAWISDPDGNQIGLIKPSSTA